MRQHDVADLPSRSSSHLTFSRYVSRLERLLADARREQVAALSRDIDVYLDRVLDNASVRAVAKKRGLHHSTVSRITAAIEDMRDRLDVVDQIIAERTAKRSG